jgi:IS4 transposase
MFAEIFAPFLAQSPVSVMFRLVLERTLRAERLDALFAATAQRQRSGELLFSSCVEALALVVAGTHKSLNAVYERQQAEWTVGVRSLYEKLAGIETQVSERLVADSADELAALVDRLLPERTPLLPGYEVRIVDGNHLAGTEHRLQPLRGNGAAALPGQALVVLDPERRLVRRMFAAEDAYVNERTLLPRVLAEVQAGQCWIADRNFSTCDFLAGIVDRGATFVIRQHGQIRGTTQGESGPPEPTETGSASEQELRIAVRERELTLRRVTIELDKSARDGARKLHLLTNLPPSVSAADVARLYRERWGIETAFMHLATVLRSEIKTLAYPPAALFGFGLGLVLYNVLRTLEASLRAAHPEATHERKFSLYYLGEEVAGVYRGMLIAIEPSRWAAFGELSEEAWLAALLDVARRVDVKRYFTKPMSTKKPPPPRPPGTNLAHRSTYRLLKKPKPS